MVQEQWQQLEMKFFIAFWHENCYLDGKINLWQGSLPGEGGLEIFKVGVGGWGTDEQIFGTFLGKTLHSYNFIDTYLLYTCYFFKPKLSIIVNGALAFVWKAKLIM